MTRPPRLEPLAVMPIARARFFWNQVATQLNEEYSTMLHREGCEWIAKEWLIIVRGQRSHQQPQDMQQRPGQQEPSGSVCVEQPANKRTL